MIPCSAAPSGWTSRLLEWQDFYARHFNVAIHLYGTGSTPVEGALVVKCPRNVADGPGPERP